MNHFEITGNLVNDVEIRFMSNQKPMALFRIAENIYDYKTKQKKGQFFNVVAFGKDAENISEYFQKGSRIHVQGHMEQRKYEKDGVNQLWYSIVVEHWEFCERRKEEKAE